MTSEARIEHFKAQDAAFLSIITPCFKRPAALARNFASIEAQGRTDIEQIRVIDEVGRGWAWVARELAEATRLASGTYVMGLDDDDELQGPGVVEHVARAVRELERLPEAIVVLCDVEWSNGTRHIVPGPAYWGKPPVKGEISGQCVLLRRDIRLKHLADFRADDDGMVIDFPWMRAALDPANHYSVLWLPLLMSRMQFRGLGRTEEELVAAGRQPTAA